MTLSAKLIFLFLTKCESFMLLKTFKNSIDSKPEIYQITNKCSLAEKIEYSYFFQDIYKKKLHVKKIGGSPPSGRYLFIWAV